MRESACVKPGLLILGLIFSLSISANEEVLNLSQNPACWIAPGRNYSNWRYSQLNQINNKNTGKLQVAWTFATGSLQGHAGGPLVLPADVPGLRSDTLFMHTSFPESVLAINLDTLMLAWTYEAQSETLTSGTECCDIVNYGISYADGKIILQQADNSLVAISIRTGSPIWKTQYGEPENIQLTTFAPFVVKDYVIIGVPGDGIAGRSRLSAYRIKDGSLAWKAYNVGTDTDVLFDANTKSSGSNAGMDSRLKYWQQGQWYRGSGVTGGLGAWDADANLVYYAASFNSQGNDNTRPAVDKYAVTIYARDIDTGVARWIYELTPRDVWGYEGVNEIILADIEINKVQVPALVYISQNGFAYTLNRNSGELLIAGKIDPAVNWAESIEIQSGRPLRIAADTLRRNPGTATGTDICPAYPGTKSKQPAAYSPRTALFYVPTSHLCMSNESVSGSSQYSTNEQRSNIRRSIFPAGNVLNDETGNMGNLVAWDAGAGKITWSIPEKFPIWSGVLATAGDVVFYGTLDGYAKAIDARTGKALWQFKVPSGVIGNFTTWSYKHKQYIGILSGKGSVADSIYGKKMLAGTGRMGGTLMVFSLP